MAKALADVVASFGLTDAQLATVRNEMKAKLGDAGQKARRTKEERAKAAGMTVAEFDAQAARKALETRVARSLGYANADELRAAQAEVKQVTRKGTAGKRGARK